MTMSRDRDPQLMFHDLFEKHGGLDLQDEATLAACHRGAEQGVLMAQVALAEFYSAHRTDPGDVFNTYAWHWAAMQQMSLACNEAAKMMTVDQVLRAEQIAVKWLTNAEKKPLMQTYDDARRRRSMTGIEPRERAVRKT